VLDDLEEVQPVTTPAVKITIPKPAVLAERNRVENERAYLASATEVSYRYQDESIELHMQSGVCVQIPRRLVDELADVPADTLRDDLRLAIGGDAISVRSLDIDIAIAGLLRDIFGLDFQRLGGRAKTAAKAAAARENGKKGGRPPALVTRGLHFPFDDPVDERTI
jgi:hypothetical protein